jgi:cytochrome c oxidase assembly protein subunit 15
MSASHEPAGPSGRLPVVSPGLFHRLAIASLVMVSVIVLTGALVRLTGSGLGCPDWPSCTQQHLTPALSFHPLIEFANRIVTVVLTIVVGAAVVGAFRRRPFRRDLAWLAVGLLVGVLAQAGLGGLVVYTKLNPYLVMVHFLASMALIVDAVVLLHRSNRRYGPGSGRPLAPPAVRLGSRGLVALLAVVLAAGTATTGAGPHAGNSQGQVVAKRIPVALRDMAELHSSLAILLVGLALGLVVALHAGEVPERVRKAGRILLAVLLAQAAVGYTQYFTHLPAALVEVHVVGATVLVIGTVQFFLALTHHPLEASNSPISSSSTTLGLGEHGGGSLVASSAGNPRGSAEAPIV